MVIFSLKEKYFQSIMERFAETSGEFSDRVESDDAVVNIRQMKKMLYGKDMN